jgi:hypothetical protein
VATTADAKSTKFKLLCNYKWPSEGDISRKFCELHYEKEKTVGKMKMVVQK